MGDEKFLPPMPPIEPGVDKEWQTDDMALMVPACVHCLHPTCKAVGNCVVGGTRFTLVKCSDFIS